MQSIGSSVAGNSSMTNANGIKKSPIADCEELKPSMRSLRDILSGKNV